jgi:DNA repair and recombination protein RAD54B
MLVLDDYSIFRKVFENPILKSRAPDASPKEVELGEARTEQVRRISSTT